MVPMLSLLKGFSSSYSEILAGTLAGSIARVLSIIYCFVLCSVLFLLQLDNKRCLASEENRTLVLGPGALIPSC